MPNGPATITYYEILLHHRSWKKGGGIIIKKNVRKGRKNEQKMDQRKRLVPVVCIKHGRTQTDKVTPKESLDKGDPEISPGCIISPFFSSTITTTKREIFTFFKMFPGALM